jgi:ubiquinone/menaquinone biosynthesis C-methylase UbiE
MKWVPESLQTWLQKKLKGIVLDGLPSAPLKYLPNKPWYYSYMVPKTADPGIEQARDGLSVPPLDLRCGYGRGDTEQYLLSGVEDVEVLMKLLAESDFSLSDGHRVLDFGCAGGRMIRCLREYANECEIWGVDVSASHILWCKAHLSPPFHFATTTTVPHMPFPDAFFDVVYAGSVFTHVDDLTDAWLLELRRILAPGGRFYCTIHDNRTMTLLDGALRGHWLADMLHKNAAYKNKRDDIGMLVIGRNTDAQVFYDLAHFRKTLDSTFQVLSVTEEAYSFQTGILASPRTEVNASRGAV